MLFGALKATPSKGFSVHKTTDLGFKDDRFRVKFEVKDDRFRVKDAFEFLVV